MMYLDVIPTFEITVCAFVTLLFVVTGFLNLKDLQSLKQEKWTRQDTIALMLRTLFFAFLVDFLLVFAVNALILASMAILKLAVAIQGIQPLIINLLGYSLAILIFTGVIYGVAKWKDWYDLIDEED
jgi:putative heme degradation protein